MTMAFYNKKKQHMYLETGASGASPGTSLLQASNWMQFTRNEAPDNAVQWPIVFTNKQPNKFKNLLKEIQNEKH